MGGYGSREDPRGKELFALGLKLYEDLCCGARVSNRLRTLSRKSPTTINRVRRWGTPWLEASTSRPSTGYPSLSSSCASTSKKNPWNRHEYAELRSE
jgi:hypothetical protein